MVVATLRPESKERSALSDLPVIDLSWKRSKLRKHLVRACEEFGFFKVINHGVPKSIIDNVDKESKEFFSLQLSEKQKIGSANPLGYGSKKIGLHGDTGDLEYLILHSNPSFIYQRVKTITNMDSLNFSCAINEYVDMVRELACNILELLGEGLRLEDRRAFSKHVMDSESDSLIRLNHYPLCIDSTKDGLSIMKSKDEKSSLRIGFGEHSDPQILTILRSNDVDGLQIESPTDSNVWIPVKSDPSAFFINVGDALQAMTNGRLLSVRHRVMANYQRSRLSTMFFAAPSLQTCISPLPEMVTDENPQRYRPYTWAEFKKIMYSLRLASNRLELFLLDCKDRTNLIR